MKNVFLLFFVLVNITVALAQSGKITGLVSFENNEPAIGVSIILTGTNKTAVTDADGHFVISNVSYGNYIIETSTIEARKKSVPVNVNSPIVNITVAVNRIESTELSEVTLNKTSEKTEIETKGFAVNVIETKEAGLRNLQTNELLDRTAGVRIRQNGGLGSEVNYNINGMSGNAVRIFIDGIPISTYGSSFDLNSIPPSMIERIEVYKGVIPGHLADDALGGAINIILKKGARNNFNTSVSYGSFNTAQSNFSGLYRFDSGFTVKASGFYNYSDNDYKVWGPDVYNILQDGSEDRVRAKRFNDAFRSIGGVIDIGFTDVKWADNFFIGFTMSDMYKEVQHGTFMTTPYKGRFTESDASLLHLTYTKKDLFTEGLEFNLHGIYGERHRVVNDTVKWNYNWFGEKSLNFNGVPFITQYGAQQGAPTIANIKRQVGSVRTGLSYSINKNHRFLVNYIYNFVNREDDDEMLSVLQRKFLGTRDLDKSIASLSYELTAFNDKLKVSVFGKNYQQRIERMDPTVETIDGEDVRVEDIVSSDKNINGYGTAISYAVLPQVFILTSAEKAVRMPTENEVFGDAGDNTTENPNIRPEISDNFNLGLRLGTLRFRKHELNVSVNGFYRNIQDRIGPEIQSALNSNIQTLPFENQGNVKSKGFDLDVNYTFNRNLNIMFNTSKFDLITIVDNQERNIPNEPTFTVNTGIHYSFNNLIEKGSRLNLFYNFMFVDTFNFLMPPYANLAGTEAFDVSQQYVHDVGISYIFPNKKLIMSFDAKNIFNRQVFDNMAVQKPGRAFYIKLNYIINNF